MKPLERNTLSTLIAVASVTLPIQAGASALMEEIVVTAQKREQNLQDVGAAVTAFSGDAMRELGMTESIDVAAQVPGLSMSTTGGLNNILNIRGVSQNDFSTHQEMPITVYMDEGYISYTSAIRFTSLDMERVEVLRGPQGTLFGRNATGGLLHFVTKKPSLAETEGDISVEVGEEGLVRVRGAIGGALGETVAARIAGSYVENDKYMQNLGVGPDGGGREEWAIRGTLLVQPTDQLQAILSVSAYEDENDSSSYGYQPSAENAEALSVKVGPGTGPKHILSNEPGAWEADGVFVNLNVSYDVGGGTFTSVTSYIENEAFHYEDSDVQSDPWGALGIPNTDSVEDQIVISDTQQNEQFTQELRFNRELDNGGNWVLGAFYMDREAAIKDHVVDWGVSFDTLLGLGIGAPFGSISNTELTTESWAVFGQVEYPISETVSLTAGLRYTDDDIDFEYVADDFIRVSPGFNGERVLLGEVSTVTGHSEDDFSGKVQLDWRPSDNVLVYGGFSRGTKGGGYNEPFLDGTLGVVSQFDGEVLEAFEVGVKSDLSDKVRLNAAAYYYDYQDYQGFAFEGLTAKLVNVDAESKGAEIELIANPAEDLDIILGLAVMDAELDNGNTMPFSPEVSANLLIRKSWFLGSGASVSLQFDGNWYDDQEMDTLNSPSALIEEKHTINTRMSYTNAADNLTVSLIGRNITDEENILFVVPVGSLGYDQVVYERPSWWSIEVSYRF